MRHATVSGQQVVDALETQVAENAQLRDLIREMEKDIGWIRELREALERFMKARGPYELFEACEKARATLNRESDHE